MLIEVITIFPSMVKNLFSGGVISRAIAAGLLETEIIDLRTYARDRHRTVDDRPFGGGEGMVLKPEPIFEAVEACNQRRQESTYVILLSPQGRQFDQNVAKELSLKTRLTLICGRYEGVDQRVAEHLADTELSIGDYVLSGGELAAGVVIDAVTRLIPGVVGDGESVLKESFMDGLLDYPQYTRPSTFRGWSVPEVLLSGDHDDIRAWRQQQALERTQRKRPDLMRRPGEEDSESGSA